MNKTDLVEKPFLRTDLPDLRPGDTVKVHVRVVEGNRERIQVFQGVVIRRSGGGIRETFTVRKISFGVGVERTFPLHSPSIGTIELVQRGRVRRAKLYYLRDLRGKKARIKERRVDDAKLAALEAASAAKVVDEDDDAQAEEVVEIVRDDDIVGVRGQRGRRRGRHRRERRPRTWPRSRQRPRPWPRGRIRQPKHPPTDPRNGRPWRELPILILVAIVVAIVIKTFLVQAFFIPSTSMVPTLRQGDRVLVCRVCNHFSGIHRGEIVVFSDPNPSAGQERGLIGGALHWLGEGIGVAQPENPDFIKRVIGLPGDVVEIDRGQVHRQRGEAGRAVPRSRSRHALVRQGRGPGGHALRPGR